MLSDLLNLGARASYLVHERARAQTMALKHPALNLPCGHDSSSSSPTEARVTNQYATNSCTNLCAMGPTTHSH